ncbi:MAG: DNA-binding protein, partial [Flavobacteriaceae bacterium]
RILLIRNKKVMIDSDIAELYGVTTKRQNQQVTRNKSRFPSHFMFQLTVGEKEEVVANCNHLDRLKYSSVNPRVFTEHGIMMLASVLKSSQAINMSIKIIEIFIAMREVLLTQSDLVLKLQEIQEKVTSHDEQISLIFEYIKQVESYKEQDFDQKNRKRIGYNKK